MSNFRLPQLILLSLSLAAPYAVTPANAAGDSSGTWCTIYSKTNNHAPKWKDTYKYYRYRGAY